MADGGYQGNRQVIMPDRRPRDGSELPAKQHELNTVRKRVHARVEHVFARMKWWNILRNCAANVTASSTYTRGIALRYNLWLVGPEDANSPAARMAPLPYHYGTAFSKAHTQSAQ